MRRVLMITLRLVAMQMLYYLVFHSQHNLCWTPALPLVGSFDLVTPLSIYYAILANNNMSEV